VGNVGDPLITVPAPKRERRRGGIKQVTGEFEPLARLGAAANIQYLSDGCDWPSLAPGLCWGTVSTGDKTFNGLDVEQGIIPVFAQYAGVECYLGQGADAEYAARAKRLLLDTEEHEVEAALIAWAEAGPVSGTATKLATAIAAADEYADQKYIGLPVIIMSRFMAVIADAEGVLHRDKDSGDLTTINGTPVVTSWVSAADKISVIGWPTVYASEVVANGVTNPTQNRELALAERIYAIAVDCLFRAVITVTLAVSDEEPEPDPDEDLVITLGSIPSSPIPDGSDATIIAQTNVVPDDDVILHYKINGGADTAAGEMTQTNPHEFVWDVQGDLTTTGDSVEVWAESGTTESNHITIEVT
jgi:hypothetical protein